MRPKVKSVKALILNGFAASDSRFDHVARFVSRQLAFAGVGPNTFVLRDHEIAECIGCYGCWVKTPGVCVFDDFGRAVAEAFITSDLVVFLSVVTFGGYSFDLKKALDRCIPLISPFFMKIKGEVHHRPRYEKYPSLLGVGLEAQPDEEDAATFRRLVARNAVNFHCPRSAAAVLTDSTSPQDMEKAIADLIGKVGLTP